MRTWVVGFLLCIVGGASPAIAKNGAPSRLFPYYEEDKEVLVLGQAMHVASRAEILDSGRHYQFLLATGIRDEEIGDGSLVVVQLYCCAGRISEDQAIWVYAPRDLRVEREDFVEIRMGRVPTKEDPGKVNTVTAIRQSAAAVIRTCRWEPDDPTLWMRVVHCDGMEQQGWLQRGAMRKLWYMPAGTVPAPLPLQPQE
jgi:hypothetical protein